MLPLLSRSALLTFALVAAALLTPTRSAANSLVAQYQFDGSLADGSGHGLDLTAGGTFAYAADRFGAASSAIHFATPDAITGTFLLGYGPNLAGMSSSISLWMRKDSGFNTSAWLLGLGHIAGVSGETGQDLHVGINYGAPIRYSFFDNGLDVNASFGGSWTNLAFTFDASTLTRRIYLDGSVIASDTALYGFSGDQYLKLGMSQVTLDDVRFYDYALAGSEVTTLSADRPAVVQGPAPGVPDGGATVVLVGLGLAGLVALKRRTS